MRRVVPLVAVIGVLCLPGSAHALSLLNAFGHPCTLQNGVNFCPTANDGQRVPSFDGVPLDVDVTVPATGGPDTVNVPAFDVPPPGAGLNTVTDAVPAVPMSAVVICA